MELGVYSIWVLGANVKPTSENSDRRPEDRLQVGCTGVLLLSDLFCVSRTETASPPDRHVDIVTAAPLRPLL